MTRTKLPADERRAVVVEAVIALAATTNPADITTAQIAAHMGQTQGALFRHFADKQAVWGAVMEWTAQTLLSRIDAATGATPLDRMRTMLLAHADFVVEYRGVPRILFGELQRTDDSAGKAQARALMQAYRGRVVALLNQAKDEGHIAPNTDTAAAATMFLGLTQGLVIQAMAADDFTPLRGAAAGMFPLYRAGLGAPQ